MDEHASSWMRLELPAAPQALQPLQALLQSQASQHGFAHAARQRMSTAAEEALTTLLRLSQEGGADAVNLLQVHLAVEGTALVLRLSDNGLPYDTSLLPAYDPREAAQLAQSEVQAAALASYLMQKLCDRCQVVNQGSQGNHIQLEWLLPLAGSNSANEPASAAPPPAAEDAAPGQTAPHRPTAIRPLQPGDAIHLARLMYRSYGYSYVNPDMYVAERILARVQDGRLVSWVATTTDARGTESIVGHIACMKAHRDDDTLEVGAAVVAPSQRGTGLLGQLLDVATAALQGRPERAAFVHAVTAHPFTQKTFGRLGYLPTALMLAYTPASLHFRHISAQGSVERGSVYYACKLLRPSAPLAVYLPQPMAALLLQSARDIQFPLLPQPLRPVALHGASHLRIAVESALNAAFISVHHAGEDFLAVLRRELRTLCRARVDAIYLSLDLSQSSAPPAAQAAQDCGFIPAGLTPFMPWPATLCLQYLNNQQLEETHVCAVGPTAQALRGGLFKAWRLREHID